MTTMSTFLAKQFPKRSAISFKMRKIGASKVTASAYHEISRKKLKITKIVAK